MTLLALIGSNKVKAPIAAIIALLVAIGVAVLIFPMPVGLAVRARLLGAAFGFFPIGWIILNVIFFHRLTVERGAFETLETWVYWS
ncbi:MAG: L-lactate permease, partial [Rhodomicrobium sp.]